MKAQSQVANPLDTTVIKNLSLKGHEWLTFIGSVNYRSADSITQIREFKLKNKIRVAILAAPGNKDAKLDADIVVDTVYGSFAFDIMRVFANKSAVYTQVYGNNAVLKLNQITHPVFVTVRSVYITNLRRDDDAVLQRGSWEIFDKQ
jgi:hypothetical protein